MEFKLMVNEKEGSATLLERHGGKWYPVAKFSNLTEVSILAEQSMGAVEVLMGLEKDKMARANEIEKFIGTIKDIDGLK